MAHYTFQVYQTSRVTRYLVAYDLQWHVLDRWCLSPASDQQAAMAATIVTERDPYDMVPQSFNPFADRR